MNVGRSIKLFPLLLVLVFAICTCAKKTVVLENRFIKGDKLKYKMSINGKGTSVIYGLPGMGGKNESQGMETPLKFELTLEYSMLVKSVDSQGTAEIDVRFENFKSITDSGGLKINVEADEKGARMIQHDTVIKDAPGFDGLNKLFTSPTVIKMDRRGRIVSIKEVGGLGGMLAHMDIYSLLEQTQLVLPETPVAIGQSWEEERDIFPLEGMAEEGAARKIPKLNAKYTLVRLASKHGRPLAEIKVKGNIQADDIDMQLPQAKESGMAMKAKLDHLKQKLDGKAFFDTNKGRLISMHMDMDQNASISMGMDVPESDVVFSSATDTKLEMDLELVEP